MGKKMVLVIMLATCTAGGLNRALADSAEHTASANLLEHEAKVAMRKAQEHRDLAEALRRTGGVQVSKWHLDEHHAALARSYEEQARAYRERTHGHHEAIKSVAKY